ncbi:MAG TPA: hypothetical protein VGL09_10015 [Methylomirabilota bacterium]
MLGHAATHDGHRSPSPDSRDFARAMTLALEDAHVTPDEVDVVFADAAGTPSGDALEAKAIREVFGVRAGRVPVTAPKSMVGRLYAGGAALDVATALLSMRDGVIPPTVNLDQRAESCELNVVTGRALPITVSTALINARGFGGFNSAMVLRKHA